MKLIRTDIIHTVETAVNIGKFDVLALACIVLSYLLYGIVVVGYSLRVSAVSGELRDRAHEYHAIRRQITENIVHKAVKVLLAVAH